jgi:hypothetical protein
MHAENSLTVDSGTLGCAAVAAVAWRGTRVLVAPGGLARAHRVS